jgi:hypothetical protein
MAAMPVITVRVDPQLLRQAELGLMLPARSPVSVIVRAALELAAGIAEPTGVVSRGAGRSAMKARISTVLRQWCPYCQRATRTWLDQYGNAWCSACQPEDDSTQEIR